MSNRSRTHGRLRMKLSFRVIALALSIIFIIGLTIFSQLNFTKKAIAGGPYYYTVSDGSWSGNVWATSAT